MRIAEPMTTLTDVAVGVVALILGVRLLGAAHGHAVTIARLWALGFAATAVAALLGAAAHGLVESMSASAHGLIWQTSLVAMGAAALVFGAAIVAEVVRPPARGWLLGILALQFVLVALVSIRAREFRYAAYGAAATMGFALAVSIAAARMGRAGAGWAIAGILVSMAAVGLQRLGWDPHPRFNHNDLFHVVQIAALWALYRGASLFVGRHPGP